MQVSDFRRELRLVGELAYTLELRHERLQSAGVDSLFIHARRVVVADLAGDAVAAGVGLGGFLQNRAQLLLVALIQFVEPPPASLVGGYRIGLQPVSAGELIEILAGVGGLIDGVDVETDHGGVGRRRLSECGESEYAGEERDFEQARTP